MKPLTALGVVWALLTTGPVARSARPGPAGPQVAFDAGGHVSHVGQAAFSASGREVITASSDKTVRVWDRATGLSKLVLRLPIGPGREGALYALAVAPEGMTVAVAGYSPVEGERGRITVMDWEADAVERALVGHKEEVRGLAFSPDGKFIASASDDFEVRVWDRAAGRTVHRLRHRGPVSAVAFSPDGRSIASASRDNTGVIWDAATGHRVAELAGHTKEVWAVAWSPDGRTVATGGRDRVLNLWDARGRLVKRLADRPNEVSALAFGRDGKSLLYGMGGPDVEDFRCHRVDLTTYADAVAYAGHDNTVSSMALSPDGDHVATAGGNVPGVSVWDAKTYRQVQRLESRSQSPSGLAWLADGSGVAWGTRRVKGVWFFDQPLQRVFDPSELSLKPHANSRPVAPARPELGDVGIQSGGLQTLNVFNKRGAGWALATKITLREEANTIQCFSLVGPERVVVGAGRTLTLHDARTGELRRRFRGHSSAVVNVAPSPDGKLFASTSLDQTVRVWHPDREEPLLSWLAAGDDWVAWTPEGYYACSPGGERLMGWHVNRGPDELAEFHPAERFRAKLYRPDVIRRVVAEGGVDRALAAADAVRGRPTEKIEVSKALPPEVRITAPAGPTHAADGPRLSVTATAAPAGNHPVRSLRLLMNGRPYAGEGGVKSFPGGGAGPVTATWEVEVPPGRHEFRVLATSSVSEGQSAAVTVKHQGGTTAPPKSRLLVLAVGVSKYQTFKPNLAYAASDAAALAQTLREKAQPAPFSEVVTTVLTDAEATRRRVIAGLKGLAKQATPADCTVVFFAGHGERDEQGNLYLVPAEGEADDLASTALDDAQLKNLIAGIPGRVFLIVDACHAGAGRDVQRANVPGDLARKLSQADSGVIVMGSSRSSEKAREDNEFRRGVYTHALIEGLSGKGSKSPQDGFVYEHHLSAYVIDAVTRLTNGAQTPTRSVPGNLPPVAMTRP